jgi:4-hydroxybenzoate polyprenyltransferase
VNWRSFVGWVGSGLLWVVGFGLMGETVWPEWRETLQLLGGFVLVVLGFRVFDKYVDIDED